MRRKLGFVWVCMILMTMFLPLKLQEVNASDICTGITKDTKIWWDGVELKIGQIGRLTVLKDTELYKLDGDKKTFARTLKAGEKYRIYAFKPGQLSVGGGYYIARDTKVKYETPSKTKLAQVGCKKQALDLTSATIELGDHKSAIDAKLGTPVRTTASEYGLNWVTYHQQYKRFYMVGYKDQVAQMIYSSDTGFVVEGARHGMSPAEIKIALGNPIGGIVKGKTKYMMDNDNQTQTFYKNGKYITVFYDIHKGSKARSFQVVSSSVEQNKPGWYGTQSLSVKVGFELQLFDLTNAARVENGLKPLVWSDLARLSARKHSEDMAANSYFDHVNLKGEDPFVRMEKEGIRFTYAGENLAMGQFNSIFAHEGLMNSLGHRENILETNFTHLGAGVFFKQGTYVPYYTENFFTP
ncbi:CAP-associated domain-containing protein [Robertmurraya beringensis]|uniref:CAP-associated domain-containing protein n=1 Tax=Robertmurraya beringensis TaxID=641660 RepID=A0ABV6KX37_9BACI